MSISFFDGISFYKGVCLLIQVFKNRKFVRDASDAADLESETLPGLLQKLLGLFVFFLLIEKAFKTENY